MKFVLLLVSDSVWVSVTLTVSLWVSPSDHDQIMSVQVLDIVMVIVVLWY